MCPPGELNGSEAVEKPRGAVYKNLTVRPIQQDGRRPGYLGEPATTAGQARPRGGGWQAGQKNDDRFMKLVRTIGVPQREHGSPCWP